MTSIKPALKVETAYAESIICTSEFIKQVDNNVGLEYPGEGSDGDARTCENDSWDVEW